nr:MAG TPA: zinc-ribbon containing domain protein [Caudoviricetes sp.]
MYIGNKIQNTATVILIIGILASIGGGIAIMSINPHNIFSGILTIVGGCLIFWITYLILSGFGQLVEDTSVLARISKISSQKDLKSLVKRGTCERCSKEDVNVINCNVDDPDGIFQKDLCFDCMLEENAEPTGNK